MLDMEVEPMTDGRGGISYEYTEELINVRMALQFAVRPEAVELMIGTFANATRLPVKGESKQYKYPFHESFKTIWFRFLGPSKSKYPTIPSIHYPVHPGLNTSLGEVC